MNFFYFDFKANNYTTITEFFHSYNWLGTFSIYNSNGTAAVLNDALFHCINKFVSLRVCKKPKFPQWLSKELKKSYC